MKRLMCVVVVVAIAFVAKPSAEAWNPIKAAGSKLKAAGRAIGSAFGVPVGGFIESATTPVIHNVEDAGHRLIADADIAIAQNLERTGVLVGGAITQVNATLDKVDGSLQARILQVQTGVDKTVDHTFDRAELMIGRLDQDLRSLIDKATRSGKQLIVELDAKVKENLKAVDQIIATRMGAFDVMVKSAIQQADDIAAARIAQLDEISGRRVGNLDVIATKQSLSLEGMLVRIAALIGLVALIAFIAWRGFREAADAFDRAESEQMSRLKALGWQGLTRFVPQLALAAAGALLLYWLSGRLPRDSVKRANEQIAGHEQAFTRAERELDVLDARYNASQLEILEPAEKLAPIRARLAKTELLHSLFTRPGQLHTPQGLANLVAQVTEVEAAMPADPDVMIAKGYILWQVGATRDDELEAVTLCASGLQSGESPLLAPLARNYIKMFLADPYVPRAGITAPSTDTLKALAAHPRTPGELAQFADVIELDEMIAKLDRDSTAAYLDMLAAQVDLRVALAQRPHPDATTVKSARDARTKAATALIAAWALFDSRLETSPTFGGEPLVLTVFTLDDSVLTRARYFATRPEDDELPPRLTGSVPAPKFFTPALRAQIAPIRIAWAQRYAPMLGPSEREVVAYEEARRFEVYEERVAQFERAYVAFHVAVRTGVAADKLADLARDAAQRAADMELYRDTPAGRRTESEEILRSAADKGVHVSDEVAAGIAEAYRTRRLRFL